MNIFLWVIQILLAMHTAIGAVWKFSHTAEQTMPSLAALPHGVWLTLSALEMLCSIWLVLPLFSRSMARLIPLAAGLIAVEMLLFCGVHLYSGSNEGGPMIYWLIVAAVGAFVIYGRTKLKPL
ncbi:MAG TPA: hypothetical protein PL182_04105 [Pseudobdellovibrionaceae bacterium]|nr:hypothetical protein [Pseudobdellovibrionaceae bacterium]